MIVIVTHWAGLLPVALSVKYFRSDWATESKLVDPLCCPLRVPWAATSGTATWDVKPMASRYGLFGDAALAAATAT